MPSISLPTLAAVTGIAGVAGAGLSAAGAYGSMEASSKNAAYQAQVAANNATIAMKNAAMDTQSGEITAANQGMKTRAAVGTTLAQQGASGVSVNSGSAPKVRAAESELGLMDALTIRSNAAKKAYADTVAATSDTAESGLLEAESTQASAAAPFSALGTFLSGASSAGGAYGKYISTA
jgi:hypothetical protein